MRRWMKWYFTISKIDLIFKKWILCKNIELKEQLSILTFSENFNFWTPLFFKNEPNCCQLHFFEQLKTITMQSRTLGSYDL